MNALERLVEIALRDVLDPEMGRSVVDLGLIYAIAAAPGGAITITMTTTTRGCPLAGFLKEAVAAENFELAAELRDRLRVLE